MNKEIQSLNEDDLKGFSDPEGGVSLHGDKHRVRDTKGGFRLNSNKAFLSSIPTHTLFLCNQIVYMKKN